jgi:hypothetical protein
MRKNYDKNSEDNASENPLTLSIGIGVVRGTSHATIIGLFKDNNGLGIGLGVCIGSILGVIF